MIAARLDLAPRDAVDYLAQKIAVPAWDYTDIWREQNAHAFTVAKSTSQDLLQAIFGEVKKAAGDDGNTFETFKKRLRPRLEEMGWWGRKEVLDIDTGEIEEVQLGSVRRLRTIYQANVQSAYMAGRNKRQVANAAARPYWRYIAIMDGRTRPAHAALNGKVWRWDDPIWKVIYPPNGWGCRCRVVALTEAEFLALGQPLESGADMIVEQDVPIGRDGDLVNLKGVRYRDETGKERMFFPDPGWDYNAGEEWAQFDRKANVPDCDWGGVADFAEDNKKTCLAGIPGQKTWKDLGRPAIADVPAEHRLPTPALLDRAPDRVTAQAVLADTLGVSKAKPLRLVETPVGEVALRYEWLAHIVEKDRDARERWANFILPTLESPYEVWLHEYADGFRHRYIGVFEEIGMLLIARLNQDGSLLWNALRAKEPYLNQRRAGLLLYGK
ncbi:phage minor head protein [Azonexus sp. R2A61]|uniref:phage minor head protein n=1 Tax=Azonexus sp. R2A61 TaxID=2744443 RepID=UPI001F2933C6|nr:phage minor head protein [Azonexus sp. R2A61]